MRTAPHRPYPIHAQMVPLEMVDQFSYTELAETLDNLPDIVKRTRLERGLRLSDVGDTIGVSVQCLSDFESRRHTPALATLIAMLRWLDTK